MTAAKGRTPGPDLHVLQRQWDEVSCPICMDHPHNAVLLICTSHEKGCRSYICDTSYRHSNCLDRFRKLRVDHNADRPDDSVTERPNHMSPSTPESFLVSPRMRRNSSETYGSRSTSDLNCPLCRGTVLGWKIVKEAREYLDLKPRSCSRESCSFSGNYTELRKHARRAHPTTRPAEVDPSRQHDWRNLEHQREYGDIVSAITSAMPGSVLLGDYVIDDGYPLADGREFGDMNGPWWATLLLVQMMDNQTGFRDEFRGSSRTRTRRTRGPSSGRRGYQVVVDDDEIMRRRRRQRITRFDDDDDDDEIMRRRRRQRITRFEDDDEIMRRRRRQRITRFEDRRY